MAPELISILPVALRRRLQGLRRPRHRPRPARRPQRVRRRRRLRPVRAVPGLRATGAIVVGPRHARLGRRACAAPSAPACSRPASAWSTSGLASTDLLYFASGRLDLAGAMLTASHNPAGVQRHQALPGRRPSDRAATPASSRSRRVAEAALAGAPPDGGVAAVAADERVEHLDLLDEFAAHVRSFVDVAALRPLKVVADTANGMGGLVVPAVFAGLPFDLEILFADLDGSFPNHPADPIQAENLADLRARVLVSRRRRRPGLRRRRRPGLPRRRARRAAVGIARRRRSSARPCSSGTPVRRSSTTSSARRRCPRSSSSAAACRSAPASATRSSRRSWPRPAPSSAASTPVTTTSGTTTAPTPGSSRRSSCSRLLSKAARAAVRAAHARSSATPTRARSTPRCPIPSRVIGEVAEHYRQPGREIDDLDGITVDLGDWWFNLRPSNTEPLLRLNLEARDADRVRPPPRRGARL